jgi:peptide subunit release factor 1 (eRF1)
MALLDEYLHESLKAKVIGRILDLPDADPRNRKELIEGVLGEYHARKEQEAVAELADLEPGKSLVSSLPQVIDACNRFAARRLLVNASLSEKGFVCREHHCVSLKEEECPVDEKNCFRWKTWWTHWRSSGVCMA